MWLSKENWNNNKKIGAVQTNLKKVEDIIFELTLLTFGGRQGKKVEVDMNIQDGGGGAEDEAMEIWL